MPAVNPDTLIGDDAAVPVRESGVEVAVYEVMLALPVSVGAVNGTEAVVPETVAVPIVGAPGERGQMPALV